MDIAALSMNMHAMQTQYSVGIAVTDKAMDTAEMEAAALLEMLQQSVPSFGHQLDIRV